MQAQCIKEDKHELHQKDAKINLVKAKPKAIVEIEVKNGPAKDY